MNAEPRWLELDAQTAGPPGILVDETHAVMTRAQLTQLMEYSTTTPDGVVPGKRWRRRARPGDQDYPATAWWLCEYYAGTGAQAHLCGTIYRAILLVD